MFAVLTGRSLSPPTFGGRRVLRSQQRRLFHRTHVADGDCGERQLLLMIDAQFDADRITEIFPAELDDVVQQYGRHSQHYQHPERLLEATCNAICCGYHDDILKYLMKNFEGQEHI